MTGHLAQRVLPSPTNSGLKAPRKTARDSGSATLTDGMTHPDTSLFAEFDAAELAAIRASAGIAESEKVRARALRRSGIVSTRRAKAEALLADILPGQLADGESLHVISHGDIDSLSYLRHLLRTHTFEHLLLSTWCMARPYVEEIHGWLRAGNLGQVDWYVGEIVPGTYADEYELVKAIVAEHGGRICVARNHSKVIAATGPGGAYVIESSANLNTNPRIEQTSITRSEDLYFFYQDFFGALRSFARD